MDDVSYDRHILQRMRRVLEHGRPGSQLDLHSNTGFSIGPANQYLEFFPYIDRLWFGESFNYNAMTPDQWLVQCSGIPFGLMGDMLQGGGNPWRGTVYGMTTRLGWETGGVHSDPRNVWKVWDDFGIADARMLGYWAPACPVKTGRDDVKATAYVRKGRALIALASWAPQRVPVTLALDWRALGLDPAKARIHAPYCERFQPAAEFRPGEAIPVQPAKGWMLIVDENPPAPGAGDALADRAPAFSDDFARDPAAAGWSMKVSPRAGTRLEVRDDALALTAAANSVAFVERPLPPHTAAVECALVIESDQGESWGPGLALVWPGGQTLRLYARSREGRFGCDVGNGGDVQQFAGTATRETRLTLRVVLGEKEIRCETSDDGLIWEPIATVPRAEFPGNPARVRVGKTGPAGDDYERPGDVGSCRILHFRAWAGMGAR